MNTTCLSLHKPHRGSLTLIEVIVVILLTLIVIIGVLAATNSSYRGNDINTELDNLEFMVNKTRVLMKENGIYDFSDSVAMTGALIEHAGVPDTMNIIGTKTSGTATLQNVWGGAVTVEPAADSNGNDTGFSITYNAVPQEACTTLAEKLSSSGLVDSTSINGTSTDGAVSVSDAGTQCTADNGSAGQNVLIFTSNT
ncbi:type 4 pilus major pilin [Klebsiella aerogenes]|uniref:type 4 pilus major pilin n=1 Tax=Klebsiella aerogenes TaxID=548 RepID=UPI0006677BE6|nr:type 4 pilus major pilin [Klebsiella aerogenes]